MTGTNTFLAELRRRKVIRVAVVYAAIAFALLEFADIAVPRLGLPDTTVDVVLGLGLVGFPVALGLAWFLAVGAEQPQWDETARISWLNWRTVLVTMVLVAGGALIGRWSSLDSRQSTGPPTSLRPTIAIAPFGNLSTDDSGNLFGRGLTEDIRTALSRYPGIRVVDPSMTFRYVITGTVRRAAESVRVSAQLRDVSNGTQIWAATYDESLTRQSDLDAQAGIAERVVSTLADPTGVLSQVGWEQARERVDAPVQGYDCVLRGYAYIAIHSEAAHLDARNCLEGAVASDPDYADAWAHLGYMYSEESNHGYNPRPNSMARAEDAARRGIALDRNNAMARFALAQIHIQRGDIEDGIAQGQRAVELNPTDSNFLSSAALDLSYSGRLDRAMEFARRATELNPSPPDWISIVFAIHHYSNGEYDQALEAISRVTLLGDPQHLMHRAAILVQLGRIEEARTAWDRLIETDSRFRVDPEGELRRRFHSTELGSLYLDALRKVWLEDARSET